MAEEDTPDRTDLAARQRGRVTLALPAVAAILLALIGGGHFAQKEHLRLQERKLQTVERAAMHARLLERRVEEAASAASLLGAVLEATHSFRTMDVVIERVMNARPEISSMQISPDGIVWRNYTNGRLGTLTEYSARRNLPLNLRLAPHGNVSVSADATGILAAQPIHSVDNSSSRYWGQIAAQVNADNLRASARLGELESDGYFHQLVFHPANGGDPVLLSKAGDGSGLMIEHALLLRGGERLVLHLYPKEGLNHNPFLLVELAWVAVAAVLLGLFLYVVVRQPDLLKRYGGASKTASLARGSELPAARDRRLLDSIFDHLPLLLTLRRVDDRTIVRVNAFAERFFGREQGSLVGKRFEELLPREQAEVLADADASVLREDRACDLPALQIQAADALRTLAFRKVPLPAPQGNPEYILDVGEDVTERQMLTISIAGQLHFLEHLIDTIPLPILVQDRDGHVVQVNQACERFFGQTREALIAGNSPSLSLLLSPAAPTSRLETRSMRLQLDDRRTADIVLQRALFETAADSRHEGGVINVIIDVTERQQAQQHIEQINRTLAVISSVNETIVRARERLPVLERACEVLVEQGGFPLAWFEFDDLPEERPAVAKGSGQENIAPIRALTGCESHCQQAEITGKIKVCSASDCSNDELRRFLTRHDYGNMIRLAITASPGRTGTLFILTSINQALTGSEEKLFGDLANDLSYAMEAIGQEEMRRQAEGKLKLAAQVFENAAEGIMITDARNRILMVNKAFSKVTGYSPDEVLGQNPRLLNSGKHDATFYQQMWQTIQKRGEWHGEVQNRRKSGQTYAEWLTISAVRNDLGEITNYVAVFTDLTSSKQIEERLNFLANYDPLTSLPNRILFNDRLEQAIAKARTDGTRVAVFFLDLDRFNLINETFGHSAGDRVLKEVGSRLKGALRPSDSASRLGGDEFAMILPALQSIAEASHVASKVMQALALPFEIDDQELYTSASVGISVFPEDGEEVETLVKNADSAMYRAMHEGRNTFRFYHQEMNARSSERIALESELRRALERGEMALHYQPFIDTASGRIVGAEALLRWNRPGFGEVSPAVFIPLLEETGLIVPFGEWILETACSANQRWRQCGFSDLFVAVNFSAVQLRGEGVPRRLADMLSRLDFAPRHLEIELTESAVMHDAERGIRTLNEFKEIGTQLSIDDFGTGYSSLAYLKRLPLDTLKIDQSFITDTPHEGEANAIVQAIVAMGHSLGLKIIAEGVRNAEQVDFLRKMRCDLLQGFYFSRPIEHERFIELLQQQAPRAAG